jgi:mannitol-1-phosphate/altronate dehydrogenase
MKQTAVEWLVKYIHSEQYQKAFGQTYISIELVEQAKAMEKEQITAFAKLWEEKLLDGRINSVDDLYNESYGK